MEIEQYVQSREDLQNQEDELRAWEASLLNSDYGEKCCKTIELRNGGKVEPMPLVTKESMLSWGKLGAINKKNVYALHRIIILVYSSAVLEETMGEITMYLFNTGTGQKICVCENHQVSETAAFVARWPRAVAMGTGGLALLISKNGVDIDKGGLIGSVATYWEDKLSTKMPYEKQLSTLVYPLNLQEPAFFMKNPRQLRSLLAKRITLGQQNEQTELEPQRIDLIEKGHATSRPRILRPKEPLVPAAPRITNVSETPSSSGTPRPPDSGDTSSTGAAKPVYVAKKGPPVKTEKTAKLPQ